jgi:zinc protease
MAMWVRVGSADEGPGEFGLAHVHEHMLFKGTDRRGVGELAREVEAAGGDINAFTSFDHTCYYVTMSSRFFDAGLDVLSDAIRNSAFDSDELDKELEVILEEISRGEDSPQTVLMHRLFGLTYATHPYGRPVIGTVESVSGYTREDVLKFYRRWYVPNNVTLVVVGDLDEADARAAIDARLADWPAGPELPVRRRAEEPTQTEMRVDVFGGNATEVHVSTAFHVPDMTHEDAPALDVLRLLLSYGETSPLVERLDRELAWVNDVSAGTYMPRDPGLFYVGFDYQPHDEHPGAAAVVGEMMRVCTDVGRHRFSAEKVLRIRTLLESSQVFRRQTVEGQAQALGYYADTEIGWEFEKEYHARLKRVTVDDVQSCVRRYLRPDNLCVVVHAPESVAPSIDPEEILEAARAGLDGASVAGAMPRAVLPRDKYGIVRVELPGGCTLLVQEDDTVPLVSVRAAFRAGLRYETAKNVGVSGVMGSLWARSTASRSYAELSQEIESMGSSLDGYAGRNTVGMSMDVLSAHLSRGVTLLTDVLVNPDFNAEELEREKRLILEALQTRTDSPGRVANLLFARAHYGPHPYSFDALGSPASISSLTREDLFGYYRRFVQPSRMVLSVVGDVVAEEIAAEVAERIDSVSFAGGDDSPQRDPVPEAKERQHRYVTAELAKQQAYIVLGFPGVTLDDPRRHAFDIISGVLSGQGGRLFLDLRDQRSLAYSVFSQSLVGLDPGAFTFQIATSPDKIDTAVRGLWDHAQQLRDSLVSEAEDARARQYLLGHHDIQLQRFGSRAFLMALDELYGIGYSAYREYADTLGGVSRADLMDIAQEFFCPSRATLVIVRPEGTALPNFTALGLPETPTQLSLQENNG